MIDLKANPAYVSEHAVLIIAVLTLCLAFVFQIPLANHPFWLVLIVAYNVFAFYKLVRNGTTEEYRYQWLLPLSLGTIWQVLASYSIEFSFSVFIAIAFAVFGMSIRRAIACVINMNLIVFCALLGKHISLSLLLWFVLFSLVLLVLFIYHNHETQQRIRKYESTLKLIEESKDQAAKNLTFDDDTPKLDAATQLLKSGQYQSKINDIMQTIADIIHTSMNAHSCVVFRYDEVEKNYKLQASKTISNAFDANAVIDPQSQSFLSFVLKNNKKFKHGNFYRLGKRLEFYYTMERINTCLIQPIIENESEKTLGLIVVDSKATYAFTEIEEKVIADFAELSAKLITAYRSYLSNDLYADYMGGYYKAVKEMILARQNYKTLLQKFIEISNMIKQSEELAILVSSESHLLSIQETQGDYLDQMLGKTIDSDSVCYELLQSNKDIMVVSYEKLRKMDKHLFYQGELKIGMSSMMLVKLPMREKTHGILFLGSKRKNHYNQLDTNAFSTLAAQFGIALENALHLEESKKLANTDGLTNLYNHRCFQETLTKYVEYARDNDATFSLLLLDIDHFKSFNDTYGHQAGDGVLKYLASLLINHVSDNDIVARYGGEEFVIILTDSDLKTAKKTAEKIRKACNKQKIRIAKDVLNITVSIGVSEFPEHANQAADLISKADAALYRAKNLGRNRVETASDHDVIN